MDGLYEAWDEKGKQTAKILYKDGVVEKVWNLTKTIK
jgi:hypothetical protein